MESQIVHIDNRRCSRVSEAKIRERALGKLPRQMSLQVTLRPKDGSTAPEVERECYFIYITT